MMKRIRRVLDKLKAILERALAKSRSTMTIISFFVPDVVVTFVATQRSAILVVEQTSC
jgi:hypothetical protein